MRMPPEEMARRRAGRMAVVKYLKRAEGSADGLGESKRENVFSTLVKCHGENIGGTYLSDSKPEISHGASVLGLCLYSAADVAHVVCEQRV